MTQSNGAARRHTAWWRDWVSAVEEPRELDDIYRLRYRIHVLEFGKPYPLADHVTQRLYDALDDSSFVLGAYRQGRLLGSHRATSASLWAFRAQYERSLRLDLFSATPPERIGYASRLVVDPSVRKHTRVSIALIVGLFEHAIDKGMHLCLCHTRAALVPFLERIGWRTYAPAFFHADSNTMQIPMVLLADDVNHLNRVGSPLSELAITIGSSHWGLEQWRLARSRADPTVAAIMDRAMPEGVQ